MNRTLTASRKNQCQAFCLMLLFASIMAVSIAIMATCVVEGRRVLAATLAGLFWGGWTLAAACYWRFYRIHELRLDDDQITSRGHFRTRSVALEEITNCKWRPTTDFSIKLAAPRGGLWIHLDPYNSEDRLTLIRFLRHRLPPDKQEGWELFCHKVALPLAKPEPTDQGGPPPPGHVRMTRRTWDCYFLPAIAVAVVGGAIAAWWSDTPRFLAAPLGFVFLWLAMRFMTPKKGMVAPRIQSDPTRWAFLKFLGLWFLVAVAWFFCDFNYLAGKPAGTVVGIGLYVAWFAILLWRAGAADKARFDYERPDREASTQAWEEQGERGA